jgi:hypothetical protein
VTVTSPITGLGASIQRQRTTQQADVVRQAILSGRLLPGMPLREAALAAELQRLLDLLAQRKELAHRKEREAPRG